MKSISSSTFRLSLNTSWKITNWCVKFAVWKYETGEFTFKPVVYTPIFVFLGLKKNIQIRLLIIGFWALIAFKIPISAFWPGYRWQLRCRNTLPAVCFLFWQTCAPQAAYSLFMKVSQTVKISPPWGCTISEAADVCEQLLVLKKGYILNQKCAFVSKSW